MLSTTDESVWANLDSHSCEICEIVLLIVNDIMNLIVEQLKRRYVIKT